MAAGILLLLTVLAQGGDPWADWSELVEYGEGAGFGQEYYPGNILGPPDPEATPEVPSSSPEELLTLGEDGWVVVEFTDNVVTDGPGPDLTVFENVMDLGGGDYFRECAFVEVSRDGETWTRFPWDPQTLEGLAGVWPTTGGDPTDPEVSGGDQFDLADLGLSWITRVRLVDCGALVEDDGLFDLDAVVAVHWETGVDGPSTAAGPMLQAVSPFRSSLTVKVSSPGLLRIFSADGRLLRSTRLPAGTSSLDASCLPAGCCLLQFVPESSAEAECCRTVKL